MASTSETGHANNVANFKTLITYVSSLGTKYSPSKADLKLTALNDLYDKAALSMETLSDALPAYKAAVTAQELAFAPLDKLVTRVVNAYKASVDDPASAEAVISIKRKMTASGAKKVAAAAGADATPGHSVSRRSYDSRLNNFNDMVHILAASPVYAPSETELQVDTLQDLHNDLLKKTNEVDVAEAPIVNNRILRDKALYTDKTGVLDIAAAVKSYVLAVYGAGSPQIKYLQKLNFRA